MATRRRKASAEAPSNGVGNPQAEGMPMQDAPEHAFDESEVVYDTTDPKHRPAITFDLEFLSPEQAEAWLATTQYDKQRERYAPHVKDIAYALAHKQYSIQAIILCEIDGAWKLTNGQHRLQAIVDSGVGTWEVVIKKHGLTSRTGAKEYSRTDRGKRRQVADALRAQVDPAEYGLTSNQVNLTSGALGLIAPGFGYTKPAIRTRLQLNSTDERVAQTMRWLKPAARYFKTVERYVKGRYKHLALASTVAVGLVTCEHAWEKAEEFWFLAATGEPKGTDDWLKVLLIDVFEKSTKEERANGPLMARYVAGVWNAYYEDKPIAQRPRPNTKEPITILGTPYKGRYTSSLINPQVEE